MAEIYKETVEKADYEVKLEIFEGPLDLLLHLIRKNEVDIFDIPISSITDQYLAYLDMMKALNINLAGDFFVMASTLIHIKSRMLLPGSEEDDQEDPRMEIARPLMEYLRLKEIAGELSERELLDKDVFGRSIPRDHMDQLRNQDPILEVNLFQLIDAFQRIMEQKIPGVVLSFRSQKWSLKEKTVQIIDLLKARKVLYFRDLFERDCSLSELIITFLAVLELVHSGLLKVFQAGPDEDIEVTMNPDEN